MKFNEKLKELRLSKGYSQYYMSNLLGINARSYQNYEYGNREPNLSTLMRLAAIFEVSLDELLCFDDFLNSPEEFFDEY